jgi:predicted Zn-dependent protease
MKKIVVLALVVGLLGCSKVPISGRRQLSLLPESQLITMSVQQYSAFISEHPKVPASNKNTQMVQRVGSKISKAVVEFLKTENQSKRVEGFNWEFNLVEDNMVNAWCMPGGKVVIYTGILPTTMNEEGLAVVMGHEVAHAIARHGNERMSQQLAIQGGGMTLSVLTSEKPELTQGIFQQAYGLGSQLGSLAYSRNHETEADKMGLVFMAMAGYNPDVAPDFWKRMAALGGAKQPELLSTHPSNETRIADIKAFLPEARKYFKSK